MIRRWAEAQGGVDPFISISILLVVTAFFAWTFWRVFNPRNRSEYERISTSLLDDAPQGEQK